MATKGKTSYDSAFGDVPANGVREQLAAGIEEAPTENAAAEGATAPDAIAGASNAPKATGQIAPPTPAADKTPAPTGNGAKTVGQVQTQLAAAMPTPTPQVSIPNQQRPGVQATLPTGGSTKAVTGDTSDKSSFGPSGSRGGQPMESAGITGDAGGAMQQIGGEVAADANAAGLRSALSNSGGPRSPMPEELPADLFDVHAQAPRDAFARGPTGFVDYNQFYGDNAGTAQRAMRAVNDRVAGTGKSAQDALAGGVAGFRSAVDAAGDDAAISGQYGGPTGFDSSPYDSAFADAVGERDALGMGAGGVQALTGGSRFGSELTNTAGGREFDRTRSQYAGLDDALAGAKSAGADYAANAQSNAADRYSQNQRAQAEQQTELADMMQYDQYVSDFSGEGSGGTHDGDGTYNTGSPMTYDEWREYNNLPPAKYGGAAPAIPVED